MRAEPRRQTYKEQHGGTRSLGVGPVVGDLVAALVHHCLNVRSLRTYVGERSASHSPLEPAPWLRCFQLEARLVTVAEQSTEASASVQANAGVFL